MEMAEITAVPETPSHDQTTSSLLVDMEISSSSSPSQLPNTETPPTSTATTTTNDVAVTATAESVIPASESPNKRRKLDEDGTSIQILPMESSSSVSIPDESQPPRHTRKAKQRKSDERKIRDAQRRSHLDPETTFHTYKASLKQIARNFSVRKKFSAGAQHMMQNVLTGELRAIMAGAAANVRRHHHTMMLSTDWVLATLDHLIPGRQNWSVDFQTIAEMCMVPGGKYHDEILRRFVDILHMHSRVTSSPESEDDASLH